MSLLTPGCFTLNQLPCDCTYSNGGPSPTTVVMTKVGDDFPFKSFTSDDGSISFTQTTNNIDFSADALNAATLQSAYNNGNTIDATTNRPIDFEIIPTSAFTVHDSGPTGLFSIESTTPGDAIVQFSNDSGITINNPIASAIPTNRDSVAFIRTGAPPSVVSVGGVISPAANTGAIGPANYAYSYTASSGLTVSFIDLRIVGRNSFINSSFTANVHVKFSPTGVVVVTNPFNEVSSDPGVGVITVEFVVTGNTINFALVSPTIPLRSYIVRSTAIISVLTYV